MAGCDLSSSLRIKNTFIHADKPPIDPVAELILPLKSVSAPSINTQASSTFSMSSTIGTPASSSCMSPMGPPHVLNGTPKGDGIEAPKSDVSKISKCVRFDFAPTFFGGDRPEDENDLEGGSNQLSPVSSGSPQLPLTALSWVSIRYTVKNTFVDVDESRPDDSDLFLPPKSVSAPSSLSVPTSPTNSDMTSDEPPSAIWPVAGRQYAPIISAALLHDDLSPMSDKTLTKPQAAKRLPSIGSAKHAIGQCKPCAWFWKVESCQWGAECQHCHLCPMGELRRKKKERRTEAKEVKRDAAALAAALADVAMGVAER